MRLIVERLGYHGPCLHSDPRGYPRGRCDRHPTGYRPIFDEAFPDPARRISGYWRSLRRGWDVSEFFLDISSAATILLTSAALFIMVETGLLLQKIRAVATPQAKTDA